ncbi:UDP-3-O-(3-hydroxymyristoyl)glucosamine N-acyltransferase [Beijerinckia sp. L45]|uniref:UDP-3-O-(3-hydroxymyristoyl)glucosamine N-acyltransferase n=1 Tax=Beijerinckia sp. L45 TaxID=1641855 RepID=UPI00131C3DD3|nr:UDP-3-O-(3-hydroxymyristoyl)glucosamine N-acyltransferase [Beijerinckia sp. L45]
MSDPLFFAPATILTLAQVVALTAAVPSSGADRDQLFQDVTAFDAAGPRTIARADDDASVAALSRTRAGACFVTPDQAQHLPTSTIALVTAVPHHAFAQVVGAFHPTAGPPASMFATRGISPAAFVHSDARLEADVTVDPGVIIGPKAEIGSGTIVGANSVIGPHVRIGRNCAIGSQVTIAHALIGNAVVIHPGARIGQDGWAAADRDRRAAIIGLGRVIIQDGVEIGANATIDRGGLADTIIGEGSRIDNLVHIERDRMIPRYADLRVTRSIAQA